MFSKNFLAQTKYLSEPSLVFQYKLKKLPVPVRNHHLLGILEMFLALSTPSHMKFDKALWVPKRHQDRCSASTKAVAGGASTYPT